MTTPSSSSPGGYKLCPQCRSIYPASANFCFRDRAALQADDRVLAGKFILLRKIGEGNMGEVYEADQPSMGRKVAVKLLRPDPEVMRRFDREVEAAGSINHPHVITIYDSGRAEDGRGYIAMEYLEGESLTQLLARQGPLATGSALQLWMQALRAMAAAHGKGVVHRDLKPDNLFIARRTGEEGTEEQVKVLDFGIAKLPHKSAQIKGTTPGAILGTMQYMAPEQMEQGETGPRSDVYALGLILVEMLAGRLPFGDTKDQSYELFALRLVRPPMPLRELCPERGLSPEMQKLVDGVLARDPAQRPAHAGELLQRAKQLPEVLTGALPDPLLSGPHASVRPAAQSPAPSLPSSLAALSSDEHTEVNLGHEAQALASPADLPGEATRVQPSPAAPPGRVRVPDTGTVSLAPRRRPWISVGVGLLFGGMLLCGYLLWRSSARGQRQEQKGAAQLPPKDPGTPAAHAPPSPPSLAPPSAPVSPGEAVAETEPRHHPSHHPAGPPLQVQFAFTDARGLMLTCGGKPQGAPDCSGNLCKSTVTLSARQRCVVDKDGIRKTFSHADLQKIAPDARGITHKFVPFP